MVELSVEVLLVFFFNCINHTISAGSVDCSFIVEGGQCCLQPAGFVWDLLCV